MSATSTTTAADELLAQARRLHEIIVDELRSLALEADKIADEVTQLVEPSPTSLLRVPYIQGIVAQARDLADLLRFDHDPPTSWAVVEQDADDLVALVEDAIRRCTVDGEEA